MIATFLISFREFLEAFLIVGVFLGISQKLKLGRRKEIVQAAFIGTIIALILPIIVFYAGERIQPVLNEKSADLLQGYLMIFSGFFIAYVIFSLHNFFVVKRSKAVLFAHQKLQENVFDISLFLTIVFFILREGFEIALFTGTTSLFSSFTQNMLGLTLGFFFAFVIGVLTFLAYIKFPIGKIYTYTEYLILVLGATMIGTGVTELTEVYFHVSLAKLIPINLFFMPTESSFAGHLLKNMFGLQRQFNLIQFTISASYIAAVYFFLLKKKKKIL